MFKRSDEPALHDLHKVQNRINGGIDMFETSNEFDTAEIIIIINEILLLLVLIVVHILLIIVVFME